MVPYDVDLVKMVQQLFNCLTSTMCPNCVEIGKRIITVQ